jgi:hypothetical protein
MHTYIYTYIHVLLFHVRILCGSQVDTCIHAYMHTYIYACMHAYTHAFHAYVHIHAYIHAYIHTHTYIQTSLHVYACTHMAQMYIHMHTYYKHTHIYTYMYIHNIYVHVYVNYLGSKWRFLWGSRTVSSFGTDGMYVCMYLHMCVCIQIYTTCFMHECMFWACLLVYGEACVHAVCVHMHTFMRIRAYTCFLTLLLQPACMRECVCTNECTHVCMYK